MSDGTPKCCASEGGRQVLPLASPEADVDLASIAKALAHPMRVRILRILLERRACLCGEIVAELPLAQATVSQHLKVLKEAGLVQGEIDGPRVCYCASPARLEWLAALVGSLTDSTPSRELEMTAA